ncbi:MAG: sulfotransferase [Phycisphaeraceae bacterium]
MPTIRAMIVGAPKAATTSLLRYIAQHPDVTTHTQREFAYFFSDREYDQGPTYCVNKYLPDACSSNRRIVTKHVFTMYRQTAIDRLHQHNPQAHVIVLLRDPVQRAYSSYWYSRRRGWDPAKTFVKSVDWELHQSGYSLEDDEGWLMDRDRMHLRVGVYHPCIRRLYDTFGRERVHVMLTDDLATNPGEVCRRVFEVLDVDATFKPDLTREHNPAAAPRSQAAAQAVARVLKSQNPIKRALRRVLPHRLARTLRHGVLRLNEKPFTPPPLSDVMRRRLAEWYAPHNQALSELIDRDLSHWSRPG